MEKLKLNLQAKTYFSLLNIEQKRAVEIDQLVENMFKKMSGNEQIKFIDAQEWPDNEKVLAYLILGFQEGSWKTRKVLFLMN